MLIVDAHQDLAWNMLTFGRDYTLAAVEIRQQERDSDAPRHNGNTLLGWPDYQRGKVAVTFATLFAAPVRRRLGTWDTQCYANPQQAKAIHHAQLDSYHKLVEDHAEKFHLILNLVDLDETLSLWATNDQQEHPVGLVILMEGAESIQQLGELDEWWELGVRIIGPAWTGTRFCGGTGEPGPLTDEGLALLDAMGDLGFALDISHMDELAALQAIDHYPGEIIASHSNAKTLLKGTESNRHLSDRLIRGIIERDGMIGVIPYNRFLLPGWKLQDGRGQCSLQQVVAHINHICQIAGDARHVGLGTDFDGGFGLEATPPEIDTIADLQKLIPLLDEKGYTTEDIAAILHQNWIRKLQQILSERS